jgi:hypothetical protein
MICKNCGSKFSNPLYLYNGSSTCPRCKKEILTISALSVTKENQEYYNLSEIAFLRYLSPKSVNGTTAEKTSQAELLVKAHYYCQLSAEQGNPHAIMQMAYLLEKFRSESKNELERIRLAIEYYGALCYSELNFVKSEKGAKEISQEEFTLLKVEAGKKMLKLCKKYSALLKSSTRYDYKKNKERLTALYKTASFQDDDFSLATSFNKVDTLIDILSSSRSKTKAPLFGVFFLSAEQFKLLLEKKGGNEQSVVAKLISKDPDFLRYMICDKTGRVASDSDRFFNRIASVKIANEVVETLKEEDYIYLYFFNAYGKHNYLTGKQIQTVKRELEENDQALLLSLVNYISEDTAVFFDDDIEQFKSGKNAHGVVTELIKSVRGEN